MAVFYERTAASIFIENFIENFLKRFLTSLGPGSGIITMVTQFVYESEPDADGNVKSGVDANPLTLFYSVVLSLWSV